MTPRKSDDALTLGEHLLEIRNYFFIIVAAVAAGAGVTHIFHVQLTQLLFQSLGTQNLVFLSPLDPLLFIFKIDFIGGFILAIPVILFCVFRFIAPVFQRRTGGIITVLVLFSILLAISATIYTYLLLLPLSIHFLLSIHVPGVENFFTAEQYIDFVLLELSMMVLIFQIPLVIVFLTLLRMLSPRILTRHRPYFYIGSTIILAIITPTTDLYSLSLFLVPTLIIFEISVILSRLVYSFQRPKTLNV